LEAVQPTPRSECTSDILAALRKGDFSNDRDRSVLQTVAVTSLPRTCPPKIRLKQANGRESVYI